MGWCVALVVAALTFASSARAFDLKDVVIRAQRLAVESYAPPTEAPPFMREIGYDQYRGMRHQARHNLWRDPGSRFEVSPVMPGGVYKHTVPINEVIGSTVRRIPFRKQDFAFDEPELARLIPEDLGLAGFELSYAFDGSTREQKFFVFAGASYFRGIGKQAQWGLSVRGAAIDTGLPSGEEFPDFTEFWLVRPQRGARRMTVYALLDSPRLTGAYEFVISPGVSTVVEVKAVLFTRRRIEQLGIAPLTSMYFYGENTPRPPEAWRPEVHDSDGLLVQDDAGRWTWQPLLNPSRITIQDFPGSTYALMQRDDHFGSYEDAEANYHRRPSALVMPRRGLEGGRVLLVQIPTSNEFMDNVVALWSPASAVEGGKRLEVEYRLEFGSPAIAHTGLGRVVNTFVGRDVVDATSMAGQHRFVVDFKGPRLDRSKASAPVAAKVDGREGTEILEHQLKRLDATNVWRLSILARAGADRPLGLRAALHVNGRQATETWSYEIDANNSIRRIQ